MSIESNPDNADTELPASVTEGTRSPDGEGCLTIGASFEGQFAGSPRITYTPHPHSPEGRLKQLEERFETLLVNLIDALKEADEASTSAALGFPVGLNSFVGGSPKQVPPRERIAQQLAEYRQYRHELLNGSVYQVFNPRVNTAGEF